MDPHANYYHHPPTWQGSNWNTSPCPSCGALHYPFCASEPPYIHYPPPAKPAAKEFSEDSHCPYCSQIHYPFCSHVASALVNSTHPYGGHDYQGNRHPEGNQSYAYSGLHPNGTPTSYDPYNSGAHPLHNYGYQTPAYPHPPDHPPPSTHPIQQIPTHHALNSSHVAFHTSQHPRQNPAEPALCLEDHLASRLGSAVPPAPHPTHPLDPTRVEPNAHSSHRPGNDDLEDYAPRRLQNSSGEERFDHTPGISPAASPQPPPPPPPSAQPEPSLPESRDFSVSPFLLQNHSCDVFILNSAAPA